MKRQVIIDTGPLVAYLDQRDRYHSWAVERWAEVHPPLLTCEAVIAEACYLLRSDPTGKTAVIDLLRRGAIKILFHLEDQAEAVSLLMKKYVNLPMSLADACLVRMTDLIPGSSVMTMDSDFHLYRKANRARLPVLMPPDR